MRIERHLVTSRPSNYWPAGVREIPELQLTLRALKQRFWDAGEPAVWPVMRGEVCDFRGTTIRLRMGIDRQPSDWEGLDHVYVFAGAQIQLAGNGLSPEVNQRPLRPSDLPYAFETWEAAVDGLASGLALIWAEDWRLGLQDALF